MLVHQRVPEGKWPWPSMFLSNTSHLQATVAAAESLQQPAAAQAAQPLTMVPWSEVRQKGRKAFTSSDLGLSENGVDSQL